MDLSRLSATQHAVRRFFQRLPAASAGLAFSEAAAALIRMARESIRVDLPESILIRESSRHNKNACILWHEQSDAVLVLAAHRNRPETDLVITTVYRYGGRLYGGELVKDESRGGLPCHTARYRPFLVVDGRQKRVFKKKPGQSFRSNRRPRRDAENRRNRRTRPTMHEDGEE